MRSLFLAVVALVLLVSCSSTGGGTMPGDCSISISGGAAASGLHCASLFTPGAFDTLRVQNVADPPAQPLSVQIICTATPLAPGTYTLPAPGSMTGCGIIVQHLTPAPMTDHVWQAQPGRGEASVVVTSVSGVDGGVTVHGHGTATAVESDTTTGMPIAGTELTMDFSF